MNALGGFSGQYASYLLSEDDYKDYIAGKDVIGRPDGQFVTPSDEMDDMLEEAQGDPRVMEEKLGLEEGSLGDNPYRVDVYYPEEYNLREADASMSGANENFEEGGETSGGMTEGVIDQFPNPETHPEVGQVSQVNSPQSEETFGPSGDGADHIGGSSGASDQEVASDYVAKAGTSEDNDYDYGYSM